MEAEEARAWFHGHFELVHAVIEGIAQRHGLRHQTPRLRARLEAKGFRGEDVAERLP